MSDLCDKRVQLILHQLEYVPAFSSSTTAVIPVAAQNASAVADAVTLVASDHAFSDHILKLLATCGEEHDSIDRVAVRRGFETLRHAAIAVGVYHVFESVEAKSENFN